MQIRKVGNKMSYIIILTLFLIYLAGICTIFGSIQPWAKKTGAGKIKQAVLDFGYKYSIYWTNFVGLWLSGTLQCSPLVVVSPWYLLGGIGMPICYSLSNYFGREEIIGYQISIEDGFVSTEDCSGLHIWIGNFWIVVGNNNLTLSKRPNITKSYKVVFELDNLAEITYGLCWGCLMLAAVIGD